MKKNRSWVRWASTYFSLSRKVQVFEVFSHRSAALEFIAEHRYLGSYPMKVRITELLPKRARKVTR